MSGFGFGSKFEEFVDRWGPLEDGDASMAFAKELRHLIEQAPAVFSVPAPKPQPALAPLPLGMVANGMRLSEKKPVWIVQTKTGFITSWVKPAYPAWYFQAGTLVGAQ